MPDLIRIKGKVDSFLHPGIQLVLVISYVPLIYSETCIALDFRYYAGSITLKRKAEWNNWRELHRVIGVSSYNDHLAGGESKLKPRAKHETFLRSRLTSAVAEFGMRLEGAV